MPVRRDAASTARDTHPLLSSRCHRPGHALTLSPRRVYPGSQDYSSLRGLTAMVTRRRKLLEFLLREDLSEFKRLTGELGIRTNQLLKPKLGGARGRRV